MSSIIKGDFSKDLTSVPKPYNQLTYIQRSYIDWKAVGGLVLTEEGELKKWRLIDLADNCKCSISAFQHVSYLPNFWDMVDQRRRDLNGQSRLAKVHNTFYLKAVAGDRTLLPIWLANNDPNFRMPMQKVEHTADDSWAGVMSNKRRIIEAKVVEKLPDGDAQV